MKSFSDQSGKAYACVVLNGKSNYTAWAFTIREHLVTAGLFRFVESPVNLVEPVAIAGDTEVIRDPAQEAKSIILSTLSASEIDKIVHCRTAHEIWAHLENSYGRKTSNAKLELLNELNSFTCKNAAEVQIVTYKILAIKGKLTSFNIDLDEMMVMNAIMRALPPKFSTFLENWSMLDVEQQNLEKFVAKLLERAKAMLDKEEEEAFVVREYNPPGRGRGSYRGRGRGRPSMDGQRASVSQSSTSVDNTNQLPSKMCPYCKKLGHFKLKRRNEEMKNNKAFDSKAEVNNMAIEVVNEDIRSSHKTTNTAPSNKYEDVVFLGDSGCSKHMVPDKSILLGYKTFPEPIPIKNGNNSLMFAQGSGTIKTSTIALDNVYFVPELSTNLFSIAMAADSGLFVNIDAKQLILFNDGGEQTIVGHRRGGTYEITLRVLKTVDLALTATTLEDWHRRLNHLPKELILKMRSSNAVEGLHIVNELHDRCKDCVLNQCKRTSHQPSLSPKACKSGQSLNFDLMGPINPVGHSGQRYILVCRDEFSSLRMISSLKSKNFTSEQVKVIINKAELETGNQYLKITTDNGTEFSSDRLAAFLKHKGILRVFSVSYVPQQNGVVERENQKLLRQSSVILNHARIGQEYWPEAAATSTYVSNRCVTRSRNKTPYELWFGKKPNINNLHIFSQHAAALKQDNQRSKFDEKGKLMYFIGYTDNYQTFKFLDPETKRIIVSCDASFLNSVGQGPLGEKSGEITLEIPNCTINVPEIVIHEKSEEHQITFTRSDFFRRRPSTQLDNILDSDGKEDIVEDLSTNEEHMSECQEEQTDEITESRTTPEVNKQTGTQSPLKTPTRPILVTDRTK